MQILDHLCHLLQTQFSQSLNKVQSRQIKTTFVYAELCVKITIVTTSSVITKTGKQNTALHHNQGPPMSRI